MCPYFGTTNCTTFGQDLLFLVTDLLIHHYSNFYIFFTVSKIIGLFSIESFYILPGSTFILEGIICKCLKMGIERKSKYKCSTC